MVRSKLKKRILRRISIALLLTSVLSTVIAYLYFNNVVRNQVINDESIKLKQMVYQLEYMMTDITNFSKSIAVDPTIQSMILVDDFDSEFDKYKTKFSLANELKFYKTLRNHVGGIVLKTDNGLFYGNIPSADDRYYDEKFSIPELQSFMNSDQIVSKPFFAYEFDVSQDVIAYKTTVRRLSNADEIVGTLILDIQLEHFLREIRVYASNYDNVILLDHDGNVIFSKQEYDVDEKGSLQPNNIKKQEITKIEDGYLILEPIEKMGWFIGTRVSNDYIWERSSFVLNFFLVFFLVSLAVLLILTSGILDAMVKPIVKLTDAMGSIDYETMAIDLNIQTNDEIQVLSERFEILLEQINQYMNQIRLDEQKQKSMAFDIMLSQINPHYLYNVLNTVVYLAKAGKNEDAVIVVNALIYSLQETLKVGEKHVFTSLDSELRLIENYVKIQQYRYPKRFDIQIQCDDKLKEAIVPKTTLQPLVENALIHGIIPKEQIGHIRIEISKVGNTLKMSVMDDGIGIDQEKIDHMFRDQESVFEGESKKQHIGLRNINDRVKHLYGKAYGLVIKNSDGEGTIVHITLPFTENK